MSAEKIAGAGGKFRKRPHRRSQTTPYDRPAMSLRPTQEKNGWFSKLVDPASKLITAGAHRLFASVFQKRILPPPSPPRRSSDDNMEKTDVQPEATTPVVHSGSKLPAVFVDNEQSSIANSNEVAELEAVLKQKTFTRSEIDHLTALLLSKTADDSVGAEGGGPESKTSELQVVFDGKHERLSKTPIHENGIEHAFPTTFSTPAIRSKVLEEDVASPAELAKAYMGSRTTTTRVSPTRLSLQNQMLTPYNQPFNQKPQTTLLQKPVNDVGTSENGFATPRFRGRSAIYSMGRTPYSRMHPTSALKASDSHIGSSSYINGSRKLTESNSQALKRQSSVLDNDIGSIGPIRRIRQKPNLLHPKTLTLPASGGPRASLGSRTIINGTDLPSSSGWSSRSHSLTKAVADNDKPSTSSGYFPSQSMEMAQKIFQVLDKFPPKGKSPQLKIGGGDSPSKTSPALLGGLAHQKTETEGSLKILESIHDSKKEDGLIGSVPKMAEEASLKKVVFSDNSAAQNGAEALFSSHGGFSYPQKKRGFQMSAHEDSFELDDDVHLNGLAPSLGELAGSAELLNASFPSFPQKEASSVEKPAVPELEPSDSLSGKKRRESFVDGPVGSNKSVSFTFPSTSSTSPSISVPKSTEESNNGAPVSDANVAVPAFTVKSEKVSPFSFSAPSRVVEAAVQDTKSEAPISGNDTKSSQELRGGLQKLDDTPSPVISSAKGVFNFGSSANTNAPVTTFSSPIRTSATSLPSVFSGISNTLPVSSVSFPSPLFSSSSGLSNGFAATSSFSLPATASPSTVTSEPAFKFGSSVVPSTLGTEPQTASASKSSTPAFGSSLAVNLSPGASLFGSGGPTTATTAPSSTDASSPSIFGASWQPSSNPTFPGSMFSTSTTPSTGFSFGAAANGASSSSLTTSSTFSTSTTPSTVFSFGAGDNGASSSSLTTSSAFSTSTTPSTVFSFGAGANGTSSSLTTSSTFTTSTTPSTGLSFGAAANGASSSSFPTSSAFSTSTTPSAVFSFGAAANGASSSSLTTSSAFNTSISPSTGFSFGAAAIGASSSLTTSSPFVFGSTPSSSPSSSPFVFGTSTSSAPAPVFPFPSSVSTPTFGFGGNTDQTSMEDTMAEDSMQAPPTAGPVFGNPPTSAPLSGFMFGAPTPSPLQAAGPGFMGAPTPGNPFQFGGQTNPIPPQNNPSPFQPSSSVEFNAGGAGSFSLGSGGGDKANRRIVRVKSKTRRK